MIILRPDQEELLAEYLHDYLRIVEIGLSIRYPLESDRAQVAKELRDILASLAPTEEINSGALTRDSSGADSPAGKDHETRDNEREHGCIYRGHSSEGVDPADRGNNPGGREIPDSVGCEENPSTSTDEQTDDIGHGPFRG